MIEKRTMGTDAENFRQTQRQKNVLFRLVENFQNFLAEQIRDEIGVMPSWISVQDAHFVARAGRSARVNLVHIVYRSEHGIHKASIAVKFFKETESNTSEDEGRGIGVKEYERACELYKRLEGYDDVKTAKPLFCSSSERVVVYEGIKGSSFSEAPLPPNEKAWLAGHALAIVHGSKLRVVNVKRSQDLAYITVMRLPINDSHKEKLLKLINPHFNLLNSACGGAITFGDFHPENVMFSTIKIKEKDVKNITWIIDPEYFEPAEEHVCRFEDVGTFFTIQVLEEFTRFGTFYEVFKDVEAFLQGYDSFLSNKTCMTLEDLYPDGIPLDFHIALGALTYALDTYIQKGATETAVIEKCLEVSEKVLAIKPFASLKYEAPSD